MRRKEAGLFRKQKEISFDKEVVWGMGMMGPIGIKKFVTCVNQCRDSQCWTCMKNQGYPPGGSKPERDTPFRTYTRLLSKIRVQTLSRRRGDYSELDDEGLGISEKC